MKSLLRRHLLALMLGVTAAAFAAGVASPAFAKNGGGDNSNSSGSESSGSSGSDSSGSSGGDDNSGGGDDNSESGGHSGGSDDNSGSSGSSDDGNDSHDDSNNRSASNDGSKNGGGGAGTAERPRIQITVDAATRAGLLNGTLVAVDNLGRPLEVEADIRNGQPVLIAKPHGGDAKRNPGPIASFDVVPASQAPVHQ